MKNIFILFTLFFSWATYAQTPQCPRGTPEYTITFSAAPIEQINQLLSADIQKVSSLAQRDDAHLLGMFHPKWHYERSGQLMTNQNNVSGARCSYISKINIKVTLVPTIYIAREAQMLTCTKNRVLAHEQQHYQNSLLALNMLKSNIQSIVPPFYDNLPIAYNNQEAQLQNYLLEQDKKAFAAISQFLSSVSDPLDSALDTKANYQLEAKQCSAQENAQISRLFYH